MPVCPNCSSEVPEDKRFCADCGTPLSSQDGLTRTSLGGQRTHTTTPISLDDSRFLPGTVLADRYRIVGLLGRGGMGEVYRADDLKLGQPVALKFLPERFAQDNDRRERFLNEARVALKVTHPNVCRVHDIGEVEGHPYLSMEYIDGEDLASLLRRIGRLPEDKAIEIGRQLCAGLAAAHDEGILHRDLKPANVMLDGRGRARITDFGLAGLEEAIVGVEVRAGTPAYMSPEQLEGKEVTVRSDLYALGLVLYELFTGKPPFSGESPADIARAHRESAPTTPTSHVSNLDPVVDSVILRCLEKNPANRPPSAVAVAAALPGGDPLAAALAAGETPSPDLVAAAGESEAISPAVALAALAVSVVIILLSATFAARDDLRAYLPLDKPPEAMEDRAREVVQKLGYTEPIYSNPGDSAIGFTVDSNYLNYIEEQDDAPGRWERLGEPRPEVVQFWYRQTPHFFFPSSSWGSVSLPRVQRMNPFPRTAGEIMVALDLAGRLAFFTKAPKRFTEEPPSVEEPDWTTLFELAGVDIAGFTPVEPRYQRYMAPDHRAAWVGRLPEAPEFELRIEAAMHAGRPVTFAMLWPWDIEGLSRDPVRITTFNAAQNVGVGIFLVVMTAGALIARRNLKRDRADRKGALRLVVAMFVLTAVWELLRTHPGLLLNPVLSFFVLASALFNAAVVGAAYVALEPYARRIWPSMLVSWSRLVGGTSLRWRDPAVGRSVLAGFAGAAVFGLSVVANDLVDTLVLGGPVRPPLGDWARLLGQGAALGGVVDAIRSGPAGACVTTLILVLARFILRRRLPAIIAVVVIFVPLGLVGQTHPSAAWVTTVFATLFIVIHLAVLLRFGFLALLVMQTVTTLFGMAITHDWTAWFARPAITAAVAMIALAVYGYWAATVGRRLIPEEDEAAL